MISSISGIYLVLFFASIVKTKFSFFSPIVLLHTKYGIGCMCTHYTHSHLNTINFWKLSIPFYSITFQTIHIYVCEVVVLSFFSLLLFNFRFVPLPINGMQCAPFLFYCLYLLLSLCREIFAQMGVHSHARSRARLTRFILYISTFLAISNRKRIDHD